MDIMEPSLSHRRLQSMPSWGDFLVLLGLCGLLFYLQKLIFSASEKWRLMMKKRIRDALEKRKKSSDKFREENGYSWDYVMVFKVYKEDQVLTESQEKHSLKFFLDSLSESGLQTKLLYSIQNDEIYCKIRVPLKRLSEEANRINYNMIAEPNMLANRLAEGNLKGPIEKQWSPISIPSDTFETTILPYEYIYLPYDTGKPQNIPLFKKWENGSIFRGVDRLKLINSIIAARKNDGGCHLDILKLIKERCLLGYFPLHDMVELKTVEERWLRFFQPPWKQHVDVVRDYYGEKIAYYFTFLGFYATWLIPAGIIGFLAWINVAAVNNNPNAVIMPYFAAFIAIWSTLFLEYWKRKESLMAMRWGTSNFEETEADRPEFFGQPTESPIDGSEILYFPIREFLMRLVQSVAIISVLIMIVLGVVASIFVMRIIMNHSSNRALVISSSIIASIANAVQIQVLNYFYGSVAIALNNYENHRTDTEYEDSLIAKTFIFQFINSFSSLFYMAFVQPFILTIDPCLKDCMTSLQTSLGTIFLTRLTSGSLMKVLMPIINRKMKEQAESDGANLADMIEVERQFMLQEYHVMLGPFQDFADLAMQFGYATMFIVAYPLATILSFVNDYVLLRVDAWKLCQLCRRPEPRSCEDIGTWYSIFEIISIAAVFVNSGLIAFTGTFAINQNWIGRVWIFLGTSAGILLAKYLTAIYVPDVSDETEIQLRRGEYIRSKVVDNVPDDLEPDLSSVSSKAEYTIRIIDDDPL